MPDRNRSGDPPDDPPNDPPVVRSPYPPVCRADSLTQDGEFELDESRFGVWSKIEDRVLCRGGPGRPRSEHSLRGTLARMDVGQSAVFPRTQLAPLWGIAKQLGIRVSTATEGTALHRMTVGPKGSRQQIVREVEAVRVWRVE